MTQARPGVVVLWDAPASMSPCAAWITQPRRPGSPARPGRCAQAAAAGGRSGWPREVRLERAKRRTACRRSPSASSRRWPRPPAPDGAVWLRRSRSGGRPAGLRAGNVQRARNLSPGRYNRGFPNFATPAAVRGARNNCPLAHDLPTCQERRSSIRLPPGTDVRLRWKRYTASVFFDKRLGAVRHRGVAGPCGHAGQARHQCRGDPRRDRAWHDADPWRDRVRRGLASTSRTSTDIEARLTARRDARRRLRLPRLRNDRVATDIRLRLVQRDRRTSPACWAPCARCWTWPSRTPTPSCPPTHPGGPAGHLRPPSAGRRGNTTRDAERAGRLPKRAKSAAGAAALAAPSYPIDREFVASQLALDGVCRNSLDAVSDRDFAIEFTAAAVAA